MENIFNPSHRKPIVKVVIFSGGRGSSVISKKLINNSQIKLTLAINGYDDGASTGTVRHFLSDSLGPSDFRKNASLLAQELHSCNTSLLKLLNSRFPHDCPEAEAINTFRIIKNESISPGSKFQNKLKSILVDLDKHSKSLIIKKLFHFEDELNKSKRSFQFSDCSFGNLVFTGCFLEKERNFNAAVTDYCSILNLPDGLIENVSDGNNSYLVAIDINNHILGSEAEIVDTNKQNHVKDIFIIDRPINDFEKSWLKSAPLDDIIRFLKERTKVVIPNSNLLDKIADADLIIYSPGTQYSSLFPSYLTHNLGVSIARNLHAIKLLITNIHEDAETPDNSAMDIIDKAVYYLKEKNRHQIPTPCLITHYLINDPAQSDHKTPYIPLGRLENIEDPRLVRIGNYEEGVTGRHNAAKLLTHFIESFLRKNDLLSISIFLLDTNSLNKIAQTILEMFRGSIQDLPFSISLYYNCKTSLSISFTKSLPFKVCNTYTTNEEASISFLRILKEKTFDYVILFESSGMYKGDDIVNLSSLLNNGRLDAVWGSRRLSIRDVHQSYKFRYRHNIVIGAASYIGSYVLSFCYLLLYGRYISDTLSGVKAIKTCYLHLDHFDLKHKYFNHHILSMLLRNQANILETPVQFFPISPEKVRRTTVLEGIYSILTILWWRFKSRRYIR